MGKERESANLVSSHTGIAVTISGNPVVLGVGNTELVRVTGGGFVGIGTTNPDSPIHVMTGSGEVIVSEVTTDQALNFIRFKDPGGNTGFIGHGNSGNDALHLWNYTNDDIRLGTNNTERLRITSNGNIGIGTTGHQTYTFDLWANPDNSNNPNDASIRLRATNYAYINFVNDAGNASTWYMGHVGSQQDEKLTIRYGSGPANQTGTLYLHKNNVISVGSASTTGDRDTTLHVMNGGAHFANTVGIGMTIGPYYGGSYSLVTDDRIYVAAGYDITPGATYVCHISANFNGYTGGIAGDSSTMYVGHNSSARELSFQTNETTRMVIDKDKATVAIGYTTADSFGSSTSLAIYNNLYLRNNQLITWNNGDVNIKGNMSSGGYGLQIESYNSTLSAMVPSIYTSGTNRAVGINTDYTSSSWGMYVQKGNGFTYESGYAGAIYAKGSVYSFAGQYLGGLGSMSTSGTTNWNDATNARSGMGYTLLLGSATNGPTATNHYFHAIGFEYSSKNGTGNLTQLAIPYYGSGLDVYYRTRYSGTWSSWNAV